MVHAFKEYNLIFDKFKYVFISRLYFFSVISCKIFWIRIFEFIFSASDSGVLKWVAVSELRCLWIWRS